MGFDHGADGLYGGIEIGRQARAVGPERMQLIGEPVLGAIALAPPLGSRFQTVKRLHETLGCSFDSAALGHRRPTPLIGPSESHQNHMRGKKLGMELYVR